MLVVQYGQSVIIIRYICIDIDRFDIVYKLEIKNKHDSRFPCNRIKTLCPIANLRFYLNGQLKQTKTGIDLALVTDISLVSLAGSLAGGNYKNCDGCHLDEIEVYQRVLAHHEVGQRYSR